MTPEDTIVAQATPAGRGGIGVVRISGKLAETIGHKITGLELQPRHASYTPFITHTGTVIDQGIAIFFPGPNSFTGEDVIELQAHGGPFLLDELIKQCTDYGARLARPGEFSERAFLNDKIDLVQAEAIADLIEAGSRQAARLALQSLQGVFSTNIRQLRDQLVALRIYIEAAIDFPEEEIDFLADEKIANDLAELEAKLAQTLAEAQQGSIMREGIHAVIIGKPNAGKSSLLNALAGQETAIVTHIEGTTRDVLRETIQIDGIPMHVTDTAGIREATDAVEEIGIKKAITEIERADLILLMTDAERDQASDLATLWPENVAMPEVPVLILRNKIDLTSDTPGQQSQDLNSINISAKEHLGLDVLKARLKTIIGYQEDHQGKFMARRRHLTALEQTVAGLTLAKKQLSAGAGELVAEELRLCQQSLNEITGEFTADDLLGEIFSSFCIGK